MSRLERAIVEIARFLERGRIPYMIIGGVANAVWGVPRTTLDVDLTVWVDEGQCETTIRQIVEKFPARTNDPVKFVKDTRVLPIETGDGVQIDVIFGQLPYEQEAIARSARQNIGGVEVRVCRPEDLILHKLVSERPRDREDVRGIVQQQHRQLDRRYLDPKVAQLAEGLNRPDMRAWYEQCVKDAGGE